MIKNSGIWFLLVSLMTWVSAAQAEGISYVPKRANGSQPEVGVGFGLGSFDVATVRYDQFDFGVGIDDFGLTVDYRLPTSLVSTNPALAPMYLFVGGIWNDDDHDDQLGARAGVGGHVFFNQLEVFAQVMPTFYVSHDSDLKLEGLIGARFWF